METLYLSLTGLLALMAVGTFATTLRKPTPYGRHLQGAPVRTLPSRAAWLIFASPEWFAFGGTFLWFTHGADASVAQWTLFALWQAHYTHRAILYPLRMRGHAAGFPLSGVAFGFAFNCLNGWVNAYAVVHAPHLAAAWLGHPAFLAGLVIALAGWAINFHSDTILIRLRADGSTGYKIPRGGLFERVSAANYFGEIVLWCGWALMTCTLAGAAFALFTIGNLAPRALSHHRWYRAHFPDYPRDRKALIPHIL